MKPKKNYSPYQIADGIIDRWMTREMAGVGQVLWTENLRRRIAASIREDRKRQSK